MRDCSGLPGPGPQVGDTSGNGELYLRGASGDLWSWLSGETQQAKLSLGCSSNLSGSNPGREALQCTACRHHDVDARHSSALSVCALRNALITEACVGKENVCPWKQLLLRSVGNGVFGYQRIHKAQLLT